MNNMIKDLYATRIQSLFRGYIFRKNFWMSHLHHVEIYVHDCVYNGNKHTLTERYSPPDRFYCDFCTNDCVEIRFTCLHGCDFDLCKNCFTRDPFPRQLNYYVNKH